MLPKPTLIAALLLSIALQASAGPAPSYQQGPKLVGAGTAGSIVYQGCSVALSADGNTAILGGFGDGNHAGAAWAFTRSGGLWSQQGAKLVGLGAVGTAYLGSSVALSADGNTAILGGVGDNAEQGSAWVFTRSGGVWSQQGAKLVGTGAMGNANQGTSVALSADGNTAVVGGYGDNSHVGAVWVYTRSGGVWSQQGAKLVGTGAVGASLQGCAVALSADGNTAIVGGSGDSADVGAAWSYTRTDGVWSQQGAKLVGTGAMGAAHQAASVALSADGNVLVAGGRNDNGGSGAAWVYTRTGGAWNQQGAKLVGTGASGAAGQGGSIALSADGTTAIVGGSSDNGSLGAAWVFTRSGGVWNQQGSKRVGTNSIGGPYQGLSVALSVDGRTALVGGFADAGDTGAAWVFIDPAPLITSVADVPNDQGRQVRLSFASSLLDHVGSSTPIVGYDVYRNSAVSLSAASRAASPAAGTGFAAPDAAQLAGWDYVVTVPARTDSLYQVVVPTLADSNSSGSHRTTLFVSAATATPGLFYDSSADSGCSVDNTPPATPAPFTGVYTGGATHLHWGRNTDPDFWFYKIYRGNSALFVPGAANQIASRPDTGYVDVGPSGGYYKLSAVDMAGNESGFNLLSPSSTADVIGGAVPRDLALAAPQPNPARWSTTLSFALPHTGPVTLGVYDLAGRRVRAVSTVRLEAGMHAVPYDLRDDAGGFVPNGLYFVRLVAGGRTLTRRLAIVE